MTDYDINAFWLLRGEIRGGDLLAQLRDFAREVERAAREAAIDECMKVCRKRAQRAGTLGRQFEAIDCAEAIRALREGGP
jgi:hypothetical protein